MDDMSQPISQQLVAVGERVAEGARNLRRMRKAELMGHAAGLGVNTRRRGPDGKPNVWRRMQAARLDCAARTLSLADPPYFAAVAAGASAASADLSCGAGEMSAGDAQRAPDAAPPAEFEPSGDAVGAADTPRQTAPSPPQPEAAPRLELGAQLLAADFAGLTGRQGKAQLRRAARVLHVRRGAAATDAKLKEACRRVVASQVTLDRYARMPGQVPEPSSDGGPGAIALAPVSGNASARAPAKPRAMRARTRSYKLAARERARCCRAQPSAKVCSRAREHGPRRKAREHGPDRKAKQRRQARERRQRRASQEQGAGA